ncbi:MAG: hypothetical protein K6B74_01555 [Ruminococcus sp.]|nr:hypothetical protein [Ruminococcus sp.]
MAYTGTYIFAERTVRITSLFERVHKYCADYRCEDVPSPDITVNITAEDIAEERVKLSSERAAEDYIEELAVYRVIAENMPRFDTFLFHGSCIAVDGRGYIFAAPSGTGKSTHTALWRRLLGDRAVMVNDDKPLIRVSGGEVTVFGTPYNGKHRLGENISVPLAGICCLERAAENSIRRAESGELYPLLFRQMYRPYSPEALAETLVLFDKMLGSVNLFRLGCNMDIGAAETAFAAMSERAERQPRS